MSILKHFLSAALLILCTALCWSSENYEVILLGDLHYDSEDIRLDVDKLPGYRKREMQRNMAAWEKNIPRVLSAAAGYSAKPSVLFTVQCGDITQGDEGKYEFAKTSFERVLQLVNKDQKKRVYAVKGNHDVRGQGKDKACSDVLGGYMKKQDVIFPLPGKDLTCYKIVGKDLFIFFDGMKESLKALEAAINAKPDARHIFLFTHIPVMPCTFSSSSIGWICGKYSKNGDKIRALLAKNKVVVLTAHTHQTSYFEWEHPEDMLKQFVSFSVVKDPAAKTGVTKFAGDEYFTFFEKNQYPKLKEKDRNALHNFLKKYYGKLNYCVRYKNVAGFNVLRVENDKVFVDIYCGKLDKAVYTQVIK